MNAQATDKQVKFALHLLDQHGYSTKSINSRHAKLDATARTYAGTVEDWLTDMDRSRISSLISKLKK